MRYKFLLFASLFFLSLTASRCKKDKTPANPIEKLPPETEIGANTFGCLVDGKVFLPQGPSLNPILTSYYQYIYYPSQTGFVFQVAANNKSSLSILKSIYILCDSIKIEEGKTYNLQQSARGFPVGNYSEYTNTSFVDFFTYSPSSGELVMKKFDEINQIASGTFWFDAVNANGDTVHVTEGRFDMQFTK